MFASIDPESRDVFDLAGYVGYQRHVAAERIGNQAELSRPGEKVLLDEKVHVREFNAVPRMRVVPADYLQLWIFLLHNFMDRAPGFLSIGDVSASLPRRRGSNNGLHPDKLPFVILADLAHQDAADLSRNRFLSVSRQVGV